MTNKRGLPKYTLEYEEKKERWELQQDKTGKVVRAYETKEKATAGGVLRKAVGSAGGSIKIQKESGRYQEERTFPKSKDPTSSAG